MVIVNDKRKSPDFYGSIESGTYFEVPLFFEDTKYFIKTNYKDKTGDYLSIDIMTGERYLFSASVPVIPLSVEINLT